MNFIAAALYAVASSVLIALVLGFHDGGLTPVAALIALSGGGVIGVFGWWCGRRAQKLPYRGGWAIAALVFFGLFSLRAFLWLIFREGDELRVLSPNNLGDMSLHLTFIRYLANGAPLWPDSPIFSAGKLTYSVGMDMFNSLLSLIGVNTERGLIWTGLLGALATGLALLRWGGAFTATGFLCNGGLAALAWFTAGRDLPIFRDYQAEWAWKSLPLSILVTQRGFLFALPAGLLLLTSWRTRFFQDGNGWRLPFLGELLLYAAMPSFHLHTFLALSFLLAAFLIARPAARMPVARLIAAAFLPATALLYLTVGMFKTNAEPMRDEMGQFENLPDRTPVDAIGWQPGWMVNDATTADIWQHVADAKPAAEPFAAHGKFLIFWFGNFGVLPFLLVPFAIALLRPVFPRGPSHTAGWAWFVVIVVITPFLGAWTGYQQKSLGVLLTGGGEFWDLRAALVPLLAVAAAIAATRLQSSPSRGSGLRQALFAISGVLMLDALLTVLHTWNPHIPLLRANATPLLLATYAFILLLWRMSQQAATGWPALIGFPALFLFFVCCNIRFARWDWDNTKMMLWCWVIVLAALWEALLVRWNPWLRAPVCALLFFSGFFSILGGIDGSHSGYSIAKLSTLDAVAQAVRGIPITEPFAAQPTYNHPLLLCGRKVVMGYDGHLSSHGIQYGPIDDELDALMRGLTDWRSHAARLGVRYLFFGPGERATWPESDEPWRMNATVIAAGEWGEIFDLATSPPPVEEPAKPASRSGPRLQPPSPKQ